MSKILKGYDLDNLERDPVKELIPLCRKAAQEGSVLLKNDGVLPIKNERLSVFGRCQKDYYKSGTGSGGLVNVAYKTNIIDSLRICDNIEINEELAQKYEAWIAENPYDDGTGWIQPCSQTEMPISGDTVRRAREFSEKAVVVIGRTAGESRDNFEEKGSWLLSDGEEAMLEAVTAQFSEVAVILNVGNIIDMSWVEKYNIKAVLYVWQGGQEGGAACADIITGAATPSGKLPDTIAKSLSDYPSYKNFADDEECIYQEDIYVGYRYFETFAKDRVLYPFGFGLSYTEFETDFDFSYGDSKITLSASVRNIGKERGKETVQVYFEAPQGTLGRPCRELMGFWKTKELGKGEGDTKTLEFPIERLAAFDDRQGLFILESGEYKIYAGTDIRSAALVGTFSLDSDIITEKTGLKLLPSKAFDRIKPQRREGGYKAVYEPVPTGSFDMDACRAELPDVPYTGDVGIKLCDVKDGKATMDAFIAQLSDEDLCNIVRGEGMSSPKVTPGTGCAFGGITEELLGFGIPPICGTDGPSGLRLDSGAKATSLPIGTLLASTWNTELIRELFVYEGIELVGNKVDALLGPGMNIHRHPLCGRNFEYFSEDPYLSGAMASAIANGFSESGVTAVIKHLAANNQEQNRHRANSVVSERALREIYLKGFEIAVKNSPVKSVMTSYNRVNGVWSANNVPLVTGVLRDEWGFDGFVMTDWWANLNPETGDEGTKENMIWFAASQNDVYMVCEDAKTRKDNLLEALGCGKIKRAELARNAANICRFALSTNALSRFLKGDYIKTGELKKHENELSTVLFLDGYNGEVRFDIEKEGLYLIKVEAKAEGDELTQGSFRVSINQGPVAFTAKGGEYQQLYREMYLIKGNHKIGVDQIKDVTIKTIRILGHGC